jgi:hypothetical protein
MAFDDGESALSIGSPPDVAWLRAFVAGSRYSVAAVPRTTGDEQGPEDVAWAPLPAVDRALVVGRKGRPFRARERRQLAALARIADHRWRQLELSRYPAQARDRSTARRQFA